MSPRFLFAGLAGILASLPPVAAQGSDLRPGLVGEYFPVKGNIETDAVDPKRKPFFVKIVRRVRFPSTEGSFNGSKLADGIFVRWSGVLRVEKAGVYEFHTTSDDGSRLYIDGRRVVDNWGPHGMEKKSGKIQLTAGDHALKITFNEGSGGAGCIAAWTPPGGKETAIPAKVLMHSPAAATAAKARWDEAAWKKVKAPKRRRSNGLTYPKTAGPVITAAVGLGNDAQGDNTVFRGIILRLDEAGEACMLFDADTMRMASAWTDNSLVLAGLPFTAGHGAYPRVSGQQVFRLRATPGWAKDGALEDPRSGDYPPLGHLPKDWSHYRGLYMAGDRVVLKYTVGGATVHESPSLVQSDEGVAVRRTFRIDRDGKAMTLVLMDAEGGVAMDETVAIVDAKALGGATVIGVSAGAGKLAHRGGSLVLDLPAGSGVTSFSVSYARVEQDGKTGKKRDLVTSHANIDLTTLTKGGAPRWPQTFPTKGVLASDAATKKNAYVVDAITVPFKNPYEPRMRIGGMDFFADGTTAAVSTWDGDVWIVSNITADLQNVRWKRFATGLHEPLGLTIVDDKVYTVDDMQITRLHDLNGDGEADFYENFNNDWELTSGFHAFCFDLKTGPQGDFFFSFGSPVRGGGRGFERMGDHHGSIMRVAKDGSKADRYATGLRAPNGIGVSPSGQLTSGDNEGTFVPRCPIHWISEGEFCGVVDSASAAQRAQLQTTATSPDRVPAGRGKTVRAAEMPKPLVWLPHGVDNSGGGQVWVTSKSWGPLEGRMLHMSYGKSALFLVLEDHRQDLVQGGVVRIPLRLSSSAMRARFNPKDGQLYIAGLRGWQTNARLEGGFDRVRYTGRPLAMPVGMKVLPTGLTITFSDPLDPEVANDPESFEVRAADIRWTQAYGTKEYRIGQRDKPAKGLREGWSDFKVTGAQLAEDGKTVTLTIDGLQPVHELEVSVDVETTGGQQIRTKIHSTIHETNR